MSFVFPTNASQVQSFAGALYGISVGTVTMAQVNNDIQANGGLSATLNSYYSATFGGVANATVANTVAANLGLTGAALTSGAAYITAQLNAAAAGARGQVISSIVNLFGNLTADATFGAAATAWNTKVAAAVTYTGASNVTMGTEVLNNTVFGMTTGVDNLTGTAGADTFSGFSETIANGGTYGASDVISGGNGNDVFNLTLTTAGPAATLNSVETVNVRATAVQTMDAAAFNGVLNLNTASSNGNVVTVTNGDLATIYGGTDANGGGVSVTLRAAQLSGTTDAVKFSATSTGTVVIPAGQAATVNTPTTFTSSSTGVEAMTLAATGTNFVTLVDATTPLATDYVTLRVTGDGRNTITASALGNLTTIDLSGTTAGTNTVRLDTALNTGTTITGGAGTDTLRVTPTTVVANLTATAMETLRIGAGDNSGTLVFASAPSFTTVRIDGDTAETGTTTLSNMGGGVTTVNYVGDSLTASAASLEVFKGLTINSSYTGSGDTVTVNIGNGGIANGAGHTMNTLSANGVESMLINVSDVTATATTTFTGITSNTLTSIKPTSAGIVVLGTIDASNAVGTGAIASLDFSTVTGTGTSSATLANGSVGAATVITATNTAGALTSVTINGAEATTDQVIFTGGVANDTLAVNAGGNRFSGVIVADGKGGNDILAGGTGADVLTGGEGADTITGNAGNDTIILTEIVSRQDIVVTADTAANNGVDTIIGFTSTADKLNVDALGTAVALTTNLTYTHAVNTVLFVPGLAAGTADGVSAALVTALNTAVAKTAALAGVVSYIIVTDNNSSALYSVADDAGTDEYTGDTIVLMATIDAVLVAGDVIFA